MCTTKEASKNTSSALKMLQGTNFDMQEQIPAKLLSGNWRATRADLQSANENITTEIKSGPWIHPAAAAEIGDRKLETGDRFAGCSLSSPLHRLVRIQLDSDVTSAMCHVHHMPSHLHQFWGKLGNPSPTCFHVKQAARFWRVSHADLPLSFFVAQLINRSLFDFETQTKKPSRWFWVPNDQTIAASFEAQTGKPSTTLVLRLNQQTHHWFLGQIRTNYRHQFWDQTKENSRYRFWGQIGEYHPSGFEAKPLTNCRHWFWGQIGENCPSGFEVKPLTNHWPWFWGSTKKPALLVFTCTV
jgi:hypothetical protein